MDPSRAAMMMGMTHELPPRPKVSQGAAGPVAQTASLARQARRLYVGNIPYGIDEVSSLLNKLTIFIDLINCNFFLKKIQIERFIGFFQFDNGSIKYYYCTG